MNRRAATDNPIVDVLAERWSPRAFAEREVTPDDLLSLFEAARWAPSSGNSQPWRFLVARRDDAAGHARLAGLLNERNRRWAPTAPVLAIALAREVDGERIQQHAHYDLGQAVSALLVQATALGLFVHQMAGFDADAARSECSVADGFAPVTAMAIGYLGSVAQLPEDLREREIAPRTREPLMSFVFGATFGEPAGFMDGGPEQPSGGAAAPSADRTRGGPADSGLGPRGVERRRDVLPDDS